MKQSSKRSWIILVAVLLGGAALWRYAQQPQASEISQGQQPAQIGPDEAGSGAGQRLDGSKSPQADAAQPLQQRSALKREGAEAIPIEFSVVELKSKTSIAGALVSIYEEQGGLPLAEAFADSQGNGSFQASPGRFRLEAVQNGYQKGTAVFSHPAPSGASHQTVFLSAAFLMRGRVRNEQGQALAGAKILLKSMHRPEISLKSDAQGSFEISLPPATYRVEVGKEPYLPKVKPFILVGPRNAPDLDIVLKKP